MLENILVDGNHRVGEITHTKAYVPCHWHRIVLGKDKPGFMVKPWINRHDHGVIVRTIYMDDVKSLIIYPSLESE